MYIIYRYKEILLLDLSMCSIQRGELILNLSESISCPSCNGENFLAKYEATYVYTYKIDTPNTKDLTNSSENLPFLFDKRDQSSSKQYIECQKCGAQYPCAFKLGVDKIDFTILRRAIRADHVTKPEFLG